MVDLQYKLFSQETSYKKLVAKLYYSNEGTSLNVENLVLRAHGEHLKYFQ